MASVKEIMTRCVNILTEAAILLLDDRSWESESGAVALLSPTVGPRLTPGDIYTALTQHQRPGHSSPQAHREELLTPWKIRKFNFISSSCQMWKQLRSWRLRLFNGQLVSQKYHFEVQTPPALLMPPLQWWLENHTNSKSINEILIEFRPPTVQILFSRAGHWMKSKNYNLPLTSATRHATDQI